MIDHLLSHANAKNRNFAAEVLDCLIANAGIFFRMAWPGADDQLSRLLGDQLFECDFIIAVDGHGGAFKDEVLVHIPSERVIVVDQDNIGGSVDRWRGVRMARGMVDEC